MRNPFKNSFIYWLFIGVLCLTACSESVKEKAPRFLIKTSLIIITPSDFLEELDLKRAAYPYDIHKNSAEYNEMVIDLVKTLSEEIILLSAAVDNGVMVTDLEVDLAEKEFKKDYPDDSFDQILLENAILYSFWKKRFRKKMIIDKFIDQALKNKIEITSREIMEFYQTYSITETQGPDNKAASGKKIVEEEELVSCLRLQKAQEYYNEWIQQLEKAYPVEINKDKLKFFLHDIEKSERNENATDEHSKN